MNVIKAIYTFIVGDIIILVGVLLIMGILILINNLRHASNPLDSFVLVQG